MQETQQAGGQRQVGPHRYGGSGAGRKGVDQPPEHGQAAHISWLEKANCINLFI